MYGASGAVRSHYLRYEEWLANQPSDRLAQKRAEADVLFHRYAPDIDEDGLRQVDELGPRIRLEKVLIDAA